MYKESKIDYNISNRIFNKQIYSKELINNYDKYNGILLLLILYLPN